jgi:hypothetical protein
MNSKRALAAAGEIAITTVGILIALAINSWWQGRQDRTFEAEILREIRTQLASDTLDMHGDQRAFAMMQGAIDTLRTRFSAATPYAADVDSMAGVLLAGRTHISNSAAWQTLKTRGVGLIRDDSLRIGIATFYEFRNRALALFNELDASIVERYRSYYRTHFVPNGTVGRGYDTYTRAKPRNYSDLTRDPDYNYLLAERGLALQQANVMYDSTRLAAISLIREIDEQLQR